MAPQVYKNIIFSPNHNGISHIFLNRPRLKNALNADTYTELTNALHEAEANMDVHIVVISGKGDYFCSGADLSEIARPGGNPPMNHPMSAPVGLFMSCVLKFPKILVAAVNGPAVGIGVTLLPHCDLVFASTEASFWVPFARIAIVPEFCSSVTLPRILGPALANEMLLCSRKLSAEEGKSKGLVSELFQPEKLLPGVEERLLAMLEPPLARESLPLFKRMIRQPNAAEMEALFESELVEVGRRYQRGDVQYAVRQVMGIKEPVTAHVAQSKL